MRKVAGVNEIGEPAHVRATVEVEPVSRTIDVLEVARGECSSASGGILEIVLGRQRDRLWKQITTNLDEVYLNGPSVDSGRRLPNNLNCSFAYVEGEGLMMAIKDVSVSSGSACTSEDSP